MHVMISLSMERLKSKYAFLLFHTCSLTTKDAHKCVNVRLDIVPRTKILVRVSSSASVCLFLINTGNERENGSARRSIVNIQ
jgi:hypothetical protein